MQFQSIADYCTVTSCYQLCYSEAISVPQLGLEFKMNS